MSISVCLALIHNNNTLRNAYILLQLENLLDTMESKSYITVEKIEVSFQPEIKPHNTVTSFMRDVMYKKLDREWYRYRLLKPHMLLRDIIGFFKMVFIKYIIKHDKIGKQWKKSSAIEVMVTAKHIRAWEKFLDTDKDFLICFEDDAIFKKDSNQKINNLLAAISENHPNMPCYVDIGGGCQLNDLMIGFLDDYQDEFYRYYNKPVTNTACAYLLSRQLVIIFYTILMKKPWLRLIGIDWMMNKLFIEMENDGVKCVCMHTAPTIVKHGTTTGEYVSWQVN